MTKLWVLTLAAAATYYTLRCRDALAELRKELSLREIESRLDKQAIHKLIAILAVERRGYAEVSRLLNDAHHRELAWQSYHFARTGDKLTKAPPAVIGSAGRTPHAEGVKRFSLNDLLAWTGPEQEDGT